MKTSTVSLLAALFISFAVAAAAPRYVERQSTAPGRDLERLSVSGRVMQIEGQRAVVRTESGARVTVHLGPRWYWEDRGYRLRSGIHVSIDGWGEMYDDNDGGFCYAGSISGDGFFFELCDSEGYPLWAGEDDDYGYGDGPEYVWHPRLDIYDVRYHDCPPPRWWYPHYRWAPYSGPRFYHHPQRPRWEHHPGPRPHRGDWTPRPRHDSDDRHDRPRPGPRPDPTHKPKPDHDGHRDGQRGRGW